MLIHPTLVDDIPKGHSRLAAIINSDLNLSMYRAFGTLRNEIILHRQLKIGMLEERLQKMNADDINRNQLNGDLQALSEREKLIDNIDKSLQDYGTLPFMFERKTG